MRRRRDRIVNSAGRGDTFLRHFLSCLGRPVNGVSLAFGPLLRSTDAESLRLQAETWVRETLSLGEPRIPSRRPA
jgi:hypothetical protein